MPLSWAIPAGMSLLGGLLGSEEKTVGKTNPTSSTTVSGGSSHRQDKLDPRMEKAIYGAGGIMPSAAEWYKNNKSGLNSQMVTGMNNQWNQLGASGQGFNQMQNLGMGLMGGGSAGNPFTGGGGIAPQQLSYTPAQQENGTVNPFTMPAATVPAAATPAKSGGGGGYSNINDAVNNSDLFRAPTAAAPQDVEYDVEGMIINRNNGQHAGYSGYRPQDWSNPTMNVPTTSTAGYGGYGGYSTLPAYSYPSGGGDY
jgi:hypothetical protein